MSQFISAPVLPEFDPSKPPEQQWRQLTRTLNDFFGDVQQRLNSAFMKNGSEPMKLTQTTLPAGTIHFDGMTRSDTINAYFDAGNWRSWDTARPSWRLMQDMGNDRVKIDRAAAATGNLTWTTYDQLPRPWAAMKMSGNQVMTSGAGPATVLFNQADGSGYSGMADTANNRFLIPITGCYALDVGVIWGNVAGGARLARLLVGGSAMTPDRLCQIPGSGASWAFTGISVTNIFSENDVVSVAAQQDSGSPVSILSGYSWFNMNFQGVGA